MKHTPVLRFAEEKDTAAIAALLSELNHDEGSDIVVKASDMRAALFVKTHPVALRARVTEMDGAVVAVMLFYPGYDLFSASVGYHLADMVVTQQYRRMGLGRMLMRALAEQALQENAAWISLTALRSNAAALRFYEAIGMTCVDVNFYAMGKKALSQL